MLERLFLHLTGWFLFDYFYYFLFDRFASKLEILSTGSVMVNKFSVDFVKFCTRQQHTKNVNGKLILNYPEGAHEHTWQGKMLCREEISGNGKDV